jgi:hypothetical protein
MPEIARNAFPHSTVAVKHTCDDALVAVRDMFFSVFPILLLDLVVPFTFVVHSVHHNA